MDIEKNIQLGLLCDIYGNLLSEKQKQMFLMYNCEDLSLGEIADIFKISRVAVFDAVKKAKEKLLHYESMLKILGTKQKLAKVVMQTENITKKQIKEIMEEM